MGPAQLETLWGQISAQLGALHSVEAGTVAEQGEYHVVDLPAAFENQSLVLRVVLTDSLQVSGFFLRPSEPPPYDAPAYVVEDLFEEVEITVGADPWLLPGVLTLPKQDGPVPVIVLVHGSGVHGAQLPADIGLDEEVVSDALSALDVARGRPEIDSSRVFLESDPGSPARSQLDSLIAVVRKVEAGEMTQDQAVLGAPPRYWQEVAEVDPVAVAEKLSTPEEYVSEASHVADEVILDLASWIQGIGG
jgi:hypothetical protein